MGKKKHSIEEENFEDEEVEEIDEEDADGIESVDGIEEFEMKEDTASTTPVEMGADLSNVSYEDFTKANEMIEEEATEDVEEEETTDTKKGAVHHVKVEENDSDSDSIEDKITEHENLMIFLSVFWTWYCRIGIAIMIILSAYYVVHGMFKDLFIYLLLLVGAYFFGYGFMFLLTKVREGK